MFILGFIMLALLFGYLQGGRLDALSQVRLRYGVLVFIALAIQITLLAWEPSSNSAWAMVDIAANAASYLCIVVFMVANSHIAGTRVLAAGLSLNLPAIISHSSSMPSATALSGVDAASLGVPSAPVGSALWYMGDILSMPKGIPFAAAFSVGDVMVGLGIFVALREMMQPVRDDIQILRPRYQPKHLVRASGRLQPARRAG
ncbi:MAG: DUF5317 family protein [Candidatus Aquicultor sp.]|nr:DUF5317 family protein [Candidatus Aquicultor sp.]